MDIQTGFGVAVIAASAPHDTEILLTIIGVSVALAFLVPALFKLFFLWMDWLWKEK